MNKTVPIITIVLALIVGGYFLLRSEDQINQTTTERDEVQQEEVGNKQAQEINNGDNEIVIEKNKGEIKEFIAVGTNFEFSIKEIRVAKGDVVRIIFKNNVGIHDWKIDEFNAATRVIRAGQEETIEFVADKVGEFEYYCSVGNHRELGMLGKFIVE